MRIIAFALAALISSCAATPPAPSVAATRIAYEVSSWGYPQERWTIAENGQATYEQTQPGAQFGSPMQPAQNFALTPADFQRIRATLAPTERFTEGGLNCEVLMTDAPYGTITWTRPDGSEQQVSFYSACRQTRDITLFFTQLNEADQIFHQLTNAPTH